ncbi:Cytochrome oxidase biogenesis protein Surf1, facilitates heme A insertion [Legionella pneumophila subsp. pneumophila LPE509]|nr:Cytochrome oxidase biogenesis protein Surf1, facilitates heme A insertion [Legionella pneumophila subsp. pneumophila LPE509]
MNKKKQTAVRISIGQFEVKRKLKQVKLGIFYQLLIWLANIPLKLAMSGV